MSLFQVCSWWSTQCPDFESSYDTNSLHCCRLHDDETEKDFIIVGSHSGYINIYKPNPVANNFNDGNDRDESLAAQYNPVDQILELKLTDPVLQLSSGKFSIDPSLKSRNQLAILHPFKISICSLQRIEGITEHGNQFKLNTCFEHKLAKTAFSVCHGYFGGNKKREFFCISHLDGTLSFFELDGISYETCLHGERNIPSIMTYNHRTDSFVTISSACELECYRYQDLGQMHDINTKTTHPAWSICLGETPLDIQIQLIKESESMIIVLGEYHLFGISDNAVVKFIKRLDYSPICLCTFVAGWYWEPDVKLIITVISDSGSLLIYNSSILIWASQLSEVPVAICRANFNELPGAIVTLGETGKVIVSYLGAEPQLFQVPPLNLRKIDFVRTQKELVELEKEIKAGIDFTDISMVNTAAERDVNVHLEISSKLESCTFPTLPQNTSSDDIKMTLVSVLVKANINIEHMQIQVTVEPPLKCSKEVWSYRNILANTTERLDTWVYVERNLDTPSAKITAVVSFVTSIPRIIEKSKFLPLELFYKSCSAQKEATYKLIIFVDKGSAPTIDALFSKHIGFEDTSHGAIGFKSVYTGAIVTIILAKNSNRYRVQCDDLSAMAIILEFLINKIENNEPKKSNGFKITTTPSIPTDTISALVCEHYSSVSAVNDIRNKLQASASQIRLFEQRLFIKLDEKRPNAMKRMSVFLKTIHKQFMEELQLLETAKDKLKRSEVKLSCALAVVTHLIRFFDMPPKVIDSLLVTLMCPVIDYPQQSWEEMLCGPLELLSYSGILRKNKGASLKENLSFNVASFDFDRVRRHLISLLERLCRIAQKGINAVDVEESSNLAPTQEEESDWVYDVEKTKEMLLPI